MTMRRRPRRTTPAALVALVALAVAVVVAVSCIQVLARRGSWLPFAAMARFGATLSLNSPLVLAVAAVLAALGLVLLAAALLPGAPTVLPLDAGESGLDTGVTRASLTHALTATAAGVDGIDRAKIRARSRRVRATVRTPLRDTSGISDRVTAALSDRLDDIAPARRPAVRVRVATTRSQ